MAKALKSGWFGKRVVILTVTGKAVTGEIVEITDDYIVLSNGVSETQVMVHAIVAITLAEGRDGTTYQRS